MLKGNAGLLALCVLLGGTAFAVVYVAPRYLGGEETPPTEVVAEARDAGTEDVPAAADPEIEQDTGSAADDTATEGAATGEQAAAPATETDEGGDAAAPAEAAAGDKQDASADEAASAPVEEQQSETPPAFDVLRVEPDGSMVVAGRAEPGSKVDIVNGDDVLASTEAGPAGNFAAVLDEPLAPGDYQIALRASNENGEEVRSEEVATVSVPRGDDDELLALVTRPGEPSRIVTAPKADGEDPAPRAEGGDAAVSAEDGNAATTAEDGNVAATADEGETSSPPATGSEVATTAGEESDGAPSADAPASAAAEDESGNRAEDAPEDTGRSVAATGEEPEMAAKTDRPVPGDTAPVDDADAETAALGEAENTAEPLATDEAVKADRPRAEVIENVRIDAVEVERDQFFVTGSAEPGATVSIYVDNVFAGSGEVSDEGRFLIEERMPMTVGKHTIRADMTIGGEVVARAIVPFTRPDEGTAAAVASAPPAVDAPTAAGADDPLAAGEEAPAAVPNEPAEIESGSAEDAGDPAAPDAPEGNQTAATAGSDAVPELAATEESGENVAAPSSAEEGSVASQPAGEAPVVAPPAPGKGDGGAIVTLRQEPLEPTDSSVIIRRGDTLWEISRRVYGRGVRYTTIYLANDEQIANPDLILPGQVFTVPEESLDNAEELHRRRVLGLDG